MGEGEKELAAKLRAIAAEVKRWEQRDYEESKGLALKSFSRQLYWLDLENIAKLFEGKHKTHAAKIVLKPGGQSKPPQRRFDIAQSIQNYMQENGVGTGEAQKALAGKFGVGEEALAKIWKEMKPLLGADDKTRALIIHFMELGSVGMARVRRVKREKG